MNSRDKGARGERELAAILKCYGYHDARRGQQYCGANGDADVVGLPGIHIECKRVERLNVYEAVRQAKRDALKSEMPVVMFRKNNEVWHAAMELADFMELYQKSIDTQEELDHLRKECSILWRKVNELEGNGGCE